VKVGRLRTGVIFILLGLILLLNTTGVLRLDVWESIATLWPLLLIAIGIEKIFMSTERFRPLAYLSPIIIAGTVAYAIFATPNGNLLADFDGDFDRDRGPERWSVDAPADIKRVDVKFDFGGGRLAVRGGAADDKALDGQFYYQRKEPDLSYDTHDDIVTIDLRRDGVHGPDFTFSRRDRERWIVKLSEILPVNLELNAGAAYVRLDLEDIICERLDLSTGASDIDVVIGERSPNVDCRIDCGAASIDLRVPAGAGVRIDKSSALSNLSTDDLDLIKRDDFLESDDFENRPVKIEIEVDAGLSSLRIHQGTTRGTGIGSSI